MMRIMPFLTLASLALNACAHAYRERIDRELGGWMKQSPDRLVESWGAPRSTYTMDNGRKVLTYEDSTFVSRTMGPLYYYPRPDVYSYSDSCKINFYTDASQKLLDSYSYTGSPGVCIDMIQSGKSAIHAPGETKPKEEGPGPASAEPVPAS